MNQGQKEPIRTTEKEGNYIKRLAPHLLKGLAGLVGGTALLAGGVIGLAYFSGYDKVEAEKKEARYGRQYIRCASKKCIDFVIEEEEIGTYQRKTEYVGGEELWVNRDILVHSPSPEKKRQEGHFCDSEVYKPAILKKIKEGVRTFVDTPPSPDHNSFGADLYPTVRLSLSYNIDQESKSDFSVNGNVQAVTGVPYEDIHAWNVEAILKRAEGDKRSNNVWKDHSTTGIQQYANTLYKFRFVELKEREKYSRSYIGIDMCVEDDYGNISPVKPWKNNETLQRTITRME